MKPILAVVATFACTLSVAACGGAAAPAGAVPAQPSQSRAGSAPAKPAASASASRAGIRLTVSFPEISGDSLPAWVAQDEGIFKKNGLDVDLRLIESAPGMAALLAGDT
ncbi:MAG TPA: hypothetical protein VMW62_15725, partial [Chloroflexota bacterium]|nr:hypothetical protein [Chloroflexota bacterium]